MDSKFARTIAEIIQSIEDAGYDPYSQLYGYVLKGKPEYITREKNAREKIKDLNWLDLKKYVEHMKDGKTIDT